MLGLSAWKSGDLARAQGAFGKALDRDPNHVKSLVNLGRVLLDAKRPEDALERLTRAADIDPLSGDAHRLLGRAYHAQGKTDEAVDAYRRAIELDPKDGWAMNNLGLLFLEQQRAADALPLLARAAELRKDVPAFHNNLGMALEHTGRFSAAAAAYSGALAADPDYGKAKQNLARVALVKEGPVEPVDPDDVATSAVEEAEIPRDDEVVGQ
jgi:tetratricopeptide (TPR) repeat protein